MKPGRTQHFYHHLLTPVVCILMATSSNAQQLPSQAALRAFQQDKSALEANAALSSIPNSILVKFRPNTNIQERNRGIAAVGAEWIRDLDIVEGLVHIRSQAPVANVLAALSANPRVEFAEPDYAVSAFETQISDPLFDLQWGLFNYGQSIRGTAGVSGADIRMLSAWEVTSGGASCLVAVIDTGVQWDHPDLAANIWQNPGEANGTRGTDNDSNGYINDWIGWDFYSNDNNPNDENGHGTHVAGTIAAVRNNSIGVAGVAPHCQIMPLRFLGPTGGGSTADAIAALNYAVKAGAKISNNSWGGGGSSTALYQAIQAAGDAGHIFVAAAGNSGVNTDRKAHYPSGYDLPNIISVAATDNRDRLASFSNYGSKTVDLGAPGVDIANAYTGSTYVWMSGTSMAAPHVAGVAAILQQKYTQLSALAVIEQILSTTRFISALNGKTLTGGVLDAHKALTAGFEVETPGEPVVQDPSAQDPPAEEPPAPETVPNSPSDLKAVDQRSGNAAISWVDKSDNEQGFQLQREKRNGGGKWGNLKTLDIAADQISLLDASGSGTFRYRISAWNNAGSSAWTEWVQVTVSR
jgi:subtilisin family serine protease